MDHGQLWDTIALCSPTSSTLAKVYFTCLFLHYALWARRQFVTHFVVSLENTVLRSCPLGFKEELMRSSKYFKLCSTMLLPGPLP